MVQLIAGNKGRGKTTELLNRVNTQIRSAKGSIVYLDKSSKHMYELNNKVRLIDVSRYPIENSDQFVGFICGIISQDHDLEALYLDGFMKCAHLRGRGRHRVPSWRSTRSASSSASTSSSPCPWTRAPSRPRSLSKVVVAL